jgi:hypothetical protein
MTTTSRLQKTRKKLTEKELGTLYAYTQLPLTIHSALTKARTPLIGAQNASMNSVQNDEFLCNIHNALLDQGPDDALLSMALCGLVLDQYLTDCDENGAMSDSLAETMRPLLTELRYTSVEVVDYLGRLRIDLDGHQIDVDPKQITSVLQRIPDDLCILSSIFQEMEDALGTHAPALARIIRVFHYQADSHADIARQYIEQMQNSEGSGAAKLDPIPLPPELQPQKDSSKIVEFSLFKR